ncbi:WD40-repeat-containing domain protein [Syncephalastrum racemosum]|uniref:WD40-repeat-containing domain protein n=1 Tax=Syncephalastrum racemosum TaxID=13706 RepID=A0A1X2GZK5_SYNRA|nr:WD40-repeat-containing domain protein [Syncephalastrum racemosum]
MTDITHYELNDAPSDGISSVKFSPFTENHLLASSWDSTVRLYDVEENALKKKFDHKAAVLDVCFGGADHAYSGGIDRQVNRLDFETGETKALGQHDDAVKALCASPENNTIYSGSWDKTLRVWDERSADAVKVSQLPQKVFSMDLSNNRLVIAMAQRHVHVYDIRNMEEPWQVRETTLKYMLKSIRCMPNGEGYACSSIEGRVALEFFDMSPESQARKYAFKSHRQVVNNQEVVYPVNALAFHPIHGTFASGGSDCVVSIWDGVHRKRIRQFQRFPDEIASLSFNKEGTKLAVASSYTFDEGERDHPPDSIFIRPMGENDCKPRVVAAAANGS